MIEIESGITVTGKGRGRPCVYPFQTMQVGDSFSIPADRANAVRASSGHWKRRHPGWDYTSRVDGGIIRIWRTA